MRTIKYTGKFKVDYRREKSGRHSRKLDGFLKPIIDLLVEDTPLPPNAVDHSMNGQRKDCCDCHIKPDLLLLNRKPDDDTLELIRLGSHSELGL
jgi:mRNA interferase YafQ